MVNKYSSGFDNASVSWMRSLKRPTGQIARWLEELGTYNLSVTHRPGSQHRNADALSRHPCSKCANWQSVSEESSLNDNEPKETDHHCPSQPTVIAIETARHVTDDSQQASTSDITNTESCYGNLPQWSSTEIRQQQLQDRDIGPIMVEHIEGNARPGWSAISHLTSAAKTLWRQWDRLEVHNGMLYRRWISDTGDPDKLQLLVPTSRKSDVMEYLHDIPTAGHLGVDTCLAKVKQNFYWPGMKDSVEQYCKACDILCGKEYSKTKQKHRLNHISI